MSACAAANYKAVHVPDGVGAGAYFWDIDRNANGAGELPNNWRYPGAECGDSCDSSAADSTYPLGMSCSGSPKKYQVFPGSNKCRNDTFC